MGTYQHIYDLAADRKGGAEALEALIEPHKPKTREELASRDVTAALIREGVIDKPPSGKRDLQKVQAAFNAWAEESGRDLTSISRTWPRASVDR